MRDFRAWREDHLAEQTRKENSEEVRMCLMQAQTEDDGEAPKVMQKYRVQLSQVKANLAYAMAEYTPSKLVNTIKAPNGHDRLRIVICGILVS